MKKIVSLILIFVMSFTLAACGNQNTEDSTINPSDNTGRSQDSKNDDTRGEAENQNRTDKQKGDVLVVYFSATGTTKKIAEYMADGMSADIYEIVPEEPYTSEDLNYNDSSSRSTTEQNDSSARPTISGTIDNMDQYDAIFIGFPIWWGEEPRIIDTFVESYDFTGKEIAVFCTSSSSGIDSVVQNLEKNAGTGTWLEGNRFSGSASSSDVMEWVNRLGFSQ